MPRGKIVGTPGSRPYRPLARAGWEELPDVQAEIQAAVDRGYEDGLQKARQDAAAELQEMCQQYTQGIASLVELREQLIEGSQRELAGLALNVAARIVRVRIEEGDPVAERVVQEMIGRVQDRDECRIRLHPEDVAILQKSEALALERGIEFIADRKISRGGAIVECGGEEIDGRLETALAALAEAVMVGA